MPGRGCFIAVNLVLSLITAVRTATMATSTALRNLGLSLITAVHTATMATPTALRIAFGVINSALRTAITALFTALRTIIFVIAPIVCCIVYVFLVAELVRYIISDYKAVVAVLFDDIYFGIAFGLAIGSLPNLLWLCIGNIFVQSFGIARAISLMITSIAVHASNFIVKAMKKLRLRMIYQVLAVLGLVILYINITLAAWSLVTRQYYSVSKYSTYHGFRGCSMDVGTPCLFFLQAPFV